MSWFITPTNSRFFQLLELDYMPDIPRSNPMKLQTWQPWQDAKRRSRTLCCLAAPVGVTKSTPGGFCHGDRVATWGLHGI